MASWLAELPSLFVGGAMLSLALLLLWLNHRKMVNWAFALLLIFRGLTGITRSGAKLAGDPPATSVWWGALPAFLIPLAPLALAFVAAYPPPGKPLVRRRWKPWHLIVLAVVLDLLYLVEPTLFWDLQAEGTSALGPELTAPAGPLFPFNTLFVAAYALVALLLAREHARTSPGPGRRSVLLISVGFALTAAFSSVSLLTFAQDLLSRHASVLDAAMVLPLAAALVFLLAQAVVLIGTYRGAEDPSTRQGVRRALLALPLPVLFVLILAVAPLGLSGTAFTTLLALGTVWHLALPVLTAYGLLRHQLFGIDLTVRWTVKQGTVAAAFVAVFFVAGEFAETFFGDVFGPYVGVLAAGVLVFFLAPLQQLAERVSDAAVPEAKDSEQMTSEERLELFRDQLRFAWADGKLDKKERRRMESLRNRLDLPEDEAYRIEAELLKET